MGFIDPLKTEPCLRCGLATHPVSVPSTGEWVYVCGLCQKLGDRSLVWLLRMHATAMTGDERDHVKARFRQARGRAWMRDDLERYLTKPRHRRPPMPPGLIQRLREKEEGRISMP